MLYLIVIVIFPLEACHYNANEVIHTKIPTVKQLYMWVAKFNIQKFNLFPTCGRLLIIDNCYKKYTFYYHYITKNLKGKRYPL